MVRATGPDRTFGVMVSLEITIFEEREEALW